MHGLLDEFLFVAEIAGESRGRVSGAMPQLRVVIVPGTGQCPVRECCWYSWISQQLSASGVQVLLPEPAMPGDSTSSVW